MWVWIKVEKVGWKAIPFTQILTKEYRSKGRDLVGKIKTIFPGPMEYAYEQQQRLQRLGYSEYIEAGNWQFSFN